MCGEGPHPHHGRQHHSTPPCWPLIGAMAYDLHYVIVLRVAIAHYDFTCLVRSASNDLHIVSWLRIYGAYLCNNTFVRYRVSVFSYAFLIFGIQVLFKAFAHIKGQQGGVEWCCLPWWGCGPSPYIIILWCKMVFWGCIFCLFFRLVFSIFEILSYLLQKARLTSSLHFFK